MKKQLVVAAMVGACVSAPVGASAVRAAQPVAPLTVNRSATLEYEGRSAVVTGTATCPAGAVYIVAVGLVQEKSGNAADPSLHLSFPACTGQPESWSVPVNVATPWAPGQADAHVELVQYRGSVVAEVDARVRLRR